MRLSTFSLRGGASFVSSFVFSATASDRVDGDDDGDPGVVVVVDDVVMNEFGSSAGFGEADVTAGTG